ncbi:DnaK suppressor protein (fragment) [Paraburkholderia piptadeniae]|uniref:DnaK suppressor protein n=1 Tax=Paraburkholderia piptadeniae TaxID=1701573 RepID=A0A1N7SVS0_9BURK
MELLHQLRDEYRDLAGARPPKTREPQSHRDEASGLDSGDAARAVLAQHDFDELHQIGQAVVRAAQNRFGLCIDCGSPIDHARLAATPDAARCVACRVQYERHASGAHR